MDLNHIEILEGELERIIFHNEENNYTVARLKIPETHESVVLVGPMAVAPGEMVSAKGLWVHDKKFGRQFKVLEYHSIVPATAYAIERYLASGLVKGIGPTFAKRMVASFGTETLEIIERDPVRLRKVPGIGPKRIEKICMAWEAQREIKSVMLFLQGHGISSTYATRIYKQYGQRAVPLIRENPYRLAQEIIGIGFVKADQIARNLGVGGDSPFRAKAGLEYVLHREAESGHVFVPADELVRHASTLLQMAPAVLSVTLEKLVDEQAVRAEKVHSESPLAIYLPHFYAAETSIPPRIHAIMRHKSQSPRPEPSEAIEWIHNTLGLDLAEGQERAVIQALSGKGAIITGGPGTGKTTIVRAIAAVFRASSAKILLAAPTGRAAKRLSETTGLTAQTIHRLLSYSPQTGFQKNRNNPLDADVLIVDEVSMVDIFLLYHLVQAVPDHIILILVGDAHQIPPVGPGQVLADLIASRCLPTIELTRIFRQAEQSLIVRNAHRILRGDFPHLPTFEETSDDFLFIDEPEPDGVVNRIRRLVSETLPKRFSLDPFQDIQVISPMNQGLTGADHLNTVLQSALNPRGPQVERRDRLFRQGDKIMQIANNYEKGIFNGDIGKIVRIEFEEQELAVSLDQREIIYDFSELDELALAYAVSVHKSQGSEYPSVLLPILPQHYMLLQRTLLYTAVTRAKRLLVVIGSKKAIGMALRNHRTANRHSLLAHRLASTFRKSE